MLLCFIIPKHFLRRLLTDFVETVLHDIALAPMKALLYPFLKSVPRINKGENKFHAELHSTVCAVFSQCKRYGKSRKQYRSSVILLYGVI